LIIEEDARERNVILQSLSRLDFKAKQKDVFAKHQEGTGRWLLEAKEFQDWLNGPISSVLWRPGNRKSSAKQRTLLEP
jgi:hypothetical protein